VAALHKRHYPPPHVPVTSGGHGVLHLVSELARTGRASLNLSTIHVTSARAVADRFRA
jgi:hypothetical protein